MPKHQVIRDAGNALLGVLRAELAASKVKGKAFLAAPTAEFLKKNAPCLCLYLYDLRPWVGARKDEPWTLEEEIVDDKGETHIVKYMRPLELDLRYLLCAAADDPADEHELLGLGMKAFLDKPKFKHEELPGDAFMGDDGLTLHEDTDFTLERSLSVFSAFGAGPRLAVGYSTQARLFTGKEMGRTKRVRQRHIDVFDPLRPPPGSVSAKELGLEPRTPKIVSTKK
jgi:Pvc16 N-terminal domain